MRRHHRLRTWDAVHRWTSLICTLFLLLLCLTGLPLIFHDEIDRAQHAALEPANVPADTPGAPLDRIVATAIAQHPGKRPLFASHEPHQLRIWYVTLATTSAGADLAQVAVDARTAAVLGEPRIGREGVMGVLFSLHSDLFAGLEGKLFLGGMGLLFVVATVSGAVLYAPFLRRRAFGTIARGRGTRAHWLDVHNLLGIATLAWATVVAFTGVINTCSELLVDQWQSSMIAVPRTASHETVESPAYRAISNDAVESSEPLQMLLDRALERARGMEVAFIAFPGTSFADAAHLGVFVRGDTPLTSRLVRPIFVDAGSAIAVERRIPWYVAALLLSEPLHFGDYGGLPLKILWAALDVFVIVILASGVYLWVARRGFKLPRPTRVGKAN